MRKKTVQDVDVTGKRVFLRVDFNVPMDNAGAISDDSRIKACLPTIKYLIDHDARVIICSHLGRPDGKVVESLRLTPVARRLSELLSKHVEALEDSVGPEVEAAVDKLKKGDVAFLENIRFHSEEEANGPNFAKALSQLADVFVNDAFGASHRAHASVVGVAKYLPAVSGFLMEKELEALSGALEIPKRPFAAMVGGAKVSGKLAVLENIVNKVDALLIGGGMAATFLKSMGYGVGNSMVENDWLDYARQLMEKAKSKSTKLLLPQDSVVAQNLEAGASTKTVPVTKIPDGWTIADIGPDTIQEFSTELKKCKTVVWNGPVGVFEIPEFAKGTYSLMKVLADLEATTVIGGGSTAEAVIEMGLADKMSHVSTGGGASLEFLEGRVLPGVAVLQDK
ncbi:MAG: phosphoglycerate kinase [Dehalococcoidia bacterium]|nr:phosphoglycerate kinase [Dehalococcoidia bacterium]